MKKSVLAGSAAIVMALGAAAIAQPRTAAGTAHYWMSAETLNGMGAGMMSGQAQQPSMRDMLGGMFGGRRRGAAAPSHSRNLVLQLGSPQRPAGTPSAEHLPPEILGAGPTLPLVTPQGAAPAAPGQATPGMPSEPRGRILIFWGCGERARAGQPIEIDLSRLARGQVPPALATMTIRPMNPPSPATAATYGHWPNERTRTAVPPAASLVGDHVVRGNYSPEIRFSLAQGQDFLPPIAITSNSRAGSGAVPVAWQAMGQARAWFMMVTGGRQDGTVVIWTSSEVQFGQMGLIDYLPPDEIARLLQQRVLMPGTATQCTVPAEVGQAVEGAMLILNAFGPEYNFSHPVRPVNAARTWVPDWVVKVRTRSAHMGLLGMTMPGMEQPQSEQPRRRRNPLGGVS